MIALRREAETLTRLAGARKYRSVSRRRLACPTANATGRVFRVFVGNARGWSGLSDIARDELVRCLYAHVYRSKFGGHWPSSRAQALSAPQRATVAEVVRERLADELSISTLAEAVSLSPFHFARSFRATTGLAPHRFVTIIRLQRAQELLVRTPMLVADVAAAVGYSNVNHFRRMFRSQIGELPSVLRRGLR